MDYPTWIARNERKRAEQRATDAIERAFAILTAAYFETGDLDDLIFELSAAQAVLVLKYLALANKGVLERLAQLEGINHDAMLARVIAEVRDRTPWLP